jgi:Domain of unknown function (DUF5658)
MADPDDPPRRESSGDRARDLILSGRLPLESETALFILLNVLDAAVTISLLFVGDHTEANPIARFFLDHWGWEGLAYYKLAMVTFVVLVAQLIARRNVRTARRLLYGLTALVGLVVVYSLYLLSRAI